MCLGLHSYLVVVVMWKQQGQSQQSRFLKFWMLSKHTIIHGRQRKIEYNTDLIIAYENTCIRWYIREMRSTRTEGRTPMIDGAISPRFYHREHGESHPRQMTKHRSPEWSTSELSWYIHVREPSFYKKRWDFWVSWSSKFSTTSPCESFFFIIFFLSWIGVSYFYKRR